MRFDNTIAPWPIPVRKSLSNYKGAEHSTRLYKFKMKDDNPKKLIPQLAIDTKFFIVHLPIFVRCETKGAVRVVCALLRNWPLGAYLPITVRYSAVNLKGSHRMRNGRIFPQKLPHFSL
jgi:hypothetical protein